MNPQESMDDNTCWLYLVRHGATANNLERPVRLQGRRTDPPLSEEGFEQARRTGELLAGAAVERVFASPLLRARQTAEAIAAPHGRAVETVEGLIEVDVGVWETLSWVEIEQRYANAYRDFMSDASAHPYLGGETMAAVLARSEPALTRLMEENLGRRIVAVAHNVVNRTWLAHLLGVPLAKYRTIPQDNCGVNVLRYRAGRTKPVTVNAALHLS